MDLGLKGKIVMITGASKGLGRAMAQVDAAALVEDEPLRRQVLDRVATQLEAVGANELGHEARGLAWGPAPPGQPELEGFAARVRHAARTESP